MKAAEREAALNASIARHPAGKQITPPVVILPDVFDCLRCEVRRAAPDRVWCDQCAPIVDALDAKQQDGAR